MNIKQAKEQIKNAMTAYFTKDEFGNSISANKSGYATAIFNVIFPPIEYPPM